MLSQTLDRLKWYKPDEVSPQENHEEATRVLSPPLASPFPEMSEERLSPKTGAVVTGFGPG